MKKKILAIVLCLTVILAYMPVYTFAEGESNTSLVLINLSENKISDGEISGDNVRITVDDDDIVYNGEEQKPGIDDITMEYKVSDTWVTVSSDHYQIVKYENNIDAGSSAKIKIQGTDGYITGEDGINCQGERYAYFEIQKRPVYADEINTVNDINLVKNAIDLININDDYNTAYEGAKAVIERKILKIDKEYDGTTSSDFDTMYAAFISENDTSEFELVGIKGTSVYNTSTCNDNAKIIFTPSYVSSNSNFRLATAAEHQAAGKSTTVKIDASISKKKVAVTPSDASIKVGEQPAITFDVGDGVYKDSELKTWLSGLTTANLTVKNISGTEVSYEDAIKTVGEYTIEYKTGSETDSTIPSNYSVTSGAGKLTVSGNTEVETADKCTLGYVAEVDGSGKASMSSLETDRLSEIGTEGDIAYAKIDLTTLGKNVRYASIPRNVFQDLFKKIEENPFVLGCVLTTSAGDLQIDSQSLGLIIGKSQSSTAADIELGFESLSSTDFNSSQNQALSAYSVLKRYDIFARIGAVTVTDLVGSLTKVTIPYTIPKGVYSYKYKIFQVGEDGTLTDMYAYYDESANNFSFYVSKLSKYVLTYEKCDGSFLCPAYFYTDVSSSDWFHQDVDFALTTGIMNGTSDTTFSPKKGITRGMIVTILWRYQNKPAAVSAGFSDVNASTYYKQAVDWAASCGIVTGYSAWSFGPNDYITREQLAAILYRYAVYLGRTMDVSGDLSKYSDAYKISSYAFSEMAWANGMGYITGSTATTINPKGTATRAEAAAILHRFIES